MAVAKKQNNKSVINIKPSNEQKKRSGSDIAAKILSIVAAVILWFYVIDVQTTQYEKQFYGISVNLSGLDTSLGLDIISGRDSTVDVTLRGTKAQINALTENDIKASADLSSVLDSGNYRVNIGISVPSGISVVEKSVGALEIIVDKTVGKTVPVNLSMTYTLPDSYEFGEISITPKNIYVSGPADLVENVSKGRAMLDLGTVSGKVTAKCSITLLDSNDNEINNPYVKSDISAVDVTVPVLKSQEKAVELVVADTKQKADCKIIPDIVTVKGDAKTVDSLDVVCTVPLEITKSSVSSIRLSLPSDVTAYDKDGNLLSEVTAVVTLIESLQSTDNISDNHIETSGEISDE